MTQLEEAIATINSRSFDMKKFYNKAYLKDTLEVLLDTLDDLQKWSVWNQDEYGDEFNYLEQTAKKIIDQVK